jgi:hypothetical protein
MSAPLKKEIDRDFPVFLQMIAGMDTNQMGPKLKLHNIVESESLPSNVFVRVRPILPGEEDTAPVVRKIEGKRDAIFMSPKITVSGVKTVTPEGFDVDCTFDGSDSNEVVYQKTCYQLVRLALDGGSACIMAYGQTGSGKTHTVSGMLPYTVRDIASQLSRVSVTLSAVELCGDDVTDLLSGNAVTVVEDKLGQVQLLNATIAEAQTEAQLVSYVEQAIAARTTRGTARNKQSSRSHMIIRLSIYRRDSPTAKPGILLVNDLAGSESTADSATHDKERLQETRAINTSLMTLKDCIRARGAIGKEKTKHIHIPFRNSRLTLVMKDAFELVVQRPTKTVIIACVSPLLQDFRHTANTLKYAALLHVSPPPVVLDVDPDDPQWWSREQCLHFLQKLFVGKVPPEVVLPDGDGHTLIQIPEAEFIIRATSHNPKLGDKYIKDKYVALWKLVIDARTNRKAKAQHAKENLARK